MSLTLRSRPVKDPWLNELPRVNAEGSVDGGGRATGIGDAGLYAGEAYVEP